MTRISEVCILGTSYDNVTTDQAVDQIYDFISRRKKCFVCTPNVDHVLRARNDKAFQDILEKSELVISDGIGVLIGSKILGTPLKENITGRLLVYKLAKLSVEKGVSIFLLGGRSQASVDLARERLEKDYPGIHICGVYSPPFMNEFSEEENREMVSRINSVEPDIVLVCFGSPKQEKWIANHVQQLASIVHIGVGATIDMLAGDVWEPPAWVTRNGLEWIVKLVQEPKRLWKRYIVGNPKFIFLVLISRFGFRS